MEEVFRQRRFTTEKYDSQYVVSVDALQLREALPMVLFLGRHEGLEVPHVVDVSRDDLLCPVANFAQLNVKLCLGHPQLYLCLYNICTHYSNNHHNHWHIVYPNSK